MKDPLRFESLSDKPLAYLVTRAPDAPGQEADPSTIAGDPGHPRGGSVVFYDVATGPDITALVTIDHNRVVVDILHLPYPVTPNGGDIVIQDDQKAVAARLNP